MQDLRDKLKQAGLVGKQQARQAALEARRERKQRQGGGRAQAPAPEPPGPRQGEQEARARELEARRREHEQKEARERVTQVIRAHALRVPRSDERAFFFAGARGKIQRLLVSVEIASRLAAGELAIAALEEPDGHALLEAAIARRVEELDPTRLLFWNRDRAPEGELPVYGSGR